MPSPIFGSEVAGFPFVLGVPEANIVSRNVSQTFLSDSIELLSFFRAAADRMFFFGAYPGPLGGPSGEIGQLATHNFFYFDVSNTIFSGSTANLVGYNQQVDITQYIGFTDRKFHDVQNTMFSPFNVPDPSRVAIVFSADCSNAFSWNSHSDDPAEALKRVYPASNSLGFSETLLNTPLVDDIYQQFTIGSTIDTTGTEFGGTCGDSGFIRQHVAFQIREAACGEEREYTPFIGESDDNSFPVVPTSAPTLGEGVLTLTHPRVSPTLTLTLRNPDFGNTDTLRFAKIDRRTRGGDRKIFADLGWSSTQSFELTVSDLCPDDVTVDEIIDFLNTSLGEEIGLLDHENRNWKGIIIAPETDVSQTNTGFIVRIIFEGELV